MKKLPFSFFLIAASLAVAIAPAKAGYSPDSQALSAEAREDVGDLRPAEDLPWSSFAYGDLHLEGQYTANSRLLGNEGSSDYLWLPAFKGGLTVPLGKQFTFEASGRIESLIYSRFQDQGSFGFSGNASLDYQYRNNLPHLFVGVQPYYYFGFDTGDRVGEAVALCTGIWDQRFLFRGKTMFFSSYTLSQVIASPSLDNRVSHRGIVGFTQQLNPATYAQIYYSIQFSDYLDQDRRDTRNVAGLNLVYQFNQNLFGNLSGHFVKNISTNPLADYRTLIFSTGITFQF